MPNKRHPEKKQFNVFLPEDLVEAVDDYATENNLSRAQAAAVIIGKVVGADKAEIARIMQLNEREEQSEQ